MVVLAQFKTNTLLPESHAASASRRGTQRQRVTKQKQREVVEKYEIGMSTREIARDLALAKTTVLRVLQQAGIKMRPRGGRNY